MKIKSLIRTALAAAGLSLAAHAAAVIQPVQIVAFTLNPALLISLANVASQNSGVITEYPADLNPAVLQVTLANHTAYEYAPCFAVEITEPGGNYSCSEETSLDAVTLVRGGMITLKTPLNPGETRLCSAADFVVSGTFSGNVNQCFQKDLEDQFKSSGDSGEGGSGGGGSSTQSSVTGLLKKNFQVCLRQVDCSSGAPGSPYPGSVPACDRFSVFNAQPGNIASVPILIYPHNNEVPTPLVNFSWTPAMHMTLRQDQISYFLEVMEEDPSTEPIQRIRIPAGQIFYVWGASDRDLRSGVKYYYRVRCLDGNGNPFGGRDGSGSNMVKWFTIKSQGNFMTLSDLDRIVRAAARGQVSVSQKLDALKIKNLVDPANLSDPLFQQLKDGRARITGIAVVRK
ncbi:MAG: hypothetical protein V4498_06010 [candidate division FCPU426 bacterium]